MVVVFPQAHDAVGHDKIKRVQWANVIQNPSIAMHHAQKKRQKVQTPHHLQKSQDTKILLDVEKRHIAEACEPYVAANENSHKIIDGVEIEIVVGQK